MAPERSWLRVAGAIAGLVLAMACFAAGSKKKEELFLSQLITVLPGSYDNLAQSRADADHPALRLIIAPVEAPLVGEHVYYVQEMAANDVRRVLAQSLYVVNPVTKKEQATLTQLEFKEP